MATQKQITANQQNALFSTGAITVEGKAIIANNAVKHGIFTKDLIIADGDGKENLADYQELLNNLIISFDPKGQMECILVEKIAVDCWRLKRVLRFETGSIRQLLDAALFDYLHPCSSYNHAEIADSKDNEKIDEDIKLKQDSVAWNNKYIKALENSEVKFDKPAWENQEITCEIEADLGAIIKDLQYEILTESELRVYSDRGLSFEQIKAIFAKAGFTDESITQYLIAKMQKENAEHNQTIAYLKQKKQKNILVEENITRTNLLPNDYTADKIMRYERSLHKSIMQNILMLKKLQGVW
jgi:hypothetical protein